MNIKLTIDSLFRIPQDGENGIVALQRACEEPIRPTEAMLGLLGADDVLIDLIKVLFVT